MIRGSRSKLTCDGSGAQVNSYGTKEGCAVEKCQRKQPHIAQQLGVGRGSWHVDSEVRLTGEVRFAVRAPLWIGLSFVQTRA